VEAINNFAKRGQAGRVRSHELDALARRALHSAGRLDWPKRATIARAAP
jgi:hypothetical protein